MTELDLKIKLNAIIANNSEFTTWTVSTPHLMMLVKQAVEEEREACAILAEKEAQYSVAEAIRKRGKQ